MTGILMVYVLTQLASALFGALLQHSYEECHLLTIPRAVLILYPGLRAGQLLSIWSKEPRNFLMNNPLVRWLKEEV